MEKDHRSLRVENKLNIAIVGNPVNTLGRDIFLCKFINILAPLASKVLVLAGKFKCKNPLPSNVTVITIQGDELQEPLIVRIFKYLLRELKYSFALVRNASTFNVVIVFGAERFIPVITSKLLGKKVLLHVGGRFSLHAPSIYKNSLMGLGKYIMPAIGQIEEKISLSLADGIIVESRAAIKNLRLERYQAKVFPYGATYVDTTIFYPPPEKDPTKRPYIGFVGRLSSEKGIIEFLKSIPIILNARPDLKFIIVGDGPLRNYVESFIKRNNLSSKILLLGFVPHEKLPHIYRKLKLLVLPSYSEGVPNVLLEAMACGTPVLASPVGGIPSIIINGKTGIILKSRKPSDIAKTIINMIINHTLLKSVSIECYKYILNHFSLESARKRYDKILRKVFYDNKTYLY